MTKNADKPYLEAILENSEVVFDSLQDSSVICDIPVVGTAFKLCRTIDDLKNKIFIAKIQNFLDGTRVDVNLKEKIKLKSLSCKEELNKVGETLILIIDRTTDINKTELYGNIFLAYLGSIISIDELRRLCQAVDSAFFDDIIEFISTKNLPKIDQDAWMQYLSGSGLTRAVGGGAFAGGQAVTYEASELGHKLRIVHEHIQKLKNC